MTTSKMVSDRLASTRAVQGSLEQNAAAIATRLAARLRPHLRAGERMPEIELLALLMGRHLAALGDEMQRADRAHQTERADDQGPRDERDARAAEVREIYTDLRNAVASSYPASALALLHLREPASSNPAVLAEQAQRAREALLDGSVALPAPRRRGGEIDRRAYAEELSPSVLSLAAALGRVEQEAKEADATHAAKLAALDAYDDAFSRVIPAVAALYTLAEQDVLAGKLRLSRRSRGTLEQDPEVPPAEG